MPLRFDILTTFPEMFSHDAPAALGVSIPARARAAGHVEWHATDIRGYAQDKHQKTDDRPFGGGPGMVMMCQPLWDAVHAVEAADPRPATRILTTPQGRPLTQSIVEDLATKPRLLIIAGHYEGIDERVIEKLSPLELSIGDYVLSGGELAAMILMDAVIRLIPGVLGHDESAGADSFSKVTPAPTKANRNPTPAASSIARTTRGRASGWASLRPTSSSAATTRKSRSGATSRCSRAPASADPTS
jgi:tRNA (guanine37-N1)-methyltransferase